jgi:hypothetical protein
MLAPRKYADPSWIVCLNSLRLVKYPVQYGNSFPTSGSISQAGRDGSDGLSAASADIHADGVEYLYVKPVEADFALSAAMISSSWP